MVIGLIGISGVGKSYLKKKTIDSFPEITSLFAATTRPKRDTECDGVDKYFISESEFRAKEENGELFLVQEIYGYMYGFLKKDIKSNPYNITEMLFTDAEEIKRFDNVVMINIYSNDTNRISKNLVARYKDCKLLIGRISEDHKLSKTHFDLRMTGFFDFSFENHFDRKSVENFLALIARICNF